MRILKIFLGLIVAIVIAKVIGSVIESGAWRSSDKKSYFAITEVLNTSNNVISVTIFMTDNKNDCESLLQGTIDGNVNADYMKINNSACVTKLPNDYAKAFENEPINDVLYIAYKNLIWPSRILMKGIDASWLSEEGCKIMIKTYQSIDKNAYCVYGIKLKD